MSNHAFRELTRFEESVVAYEGLVQQLGDGYAMCIYEYTNDLSCRQRLEKTLGWNPLSKSYGRESRLLTLDAPDITTDEALHTRLLPPRMFLVLGIPAR